MHYRSTCILARSVFKASRAESVKKNSLKKSISQILTSNQIIIESSSLILEILCLARSIAIHLLFTHDVIKYLTPMLFILEINFFPKQLFCCRQSFRCCMKNYVKYHCSKMCGTFFCCIIRRLCVK